jgi:hypothetical protein
LLGGRGKSFPSKLRLTATTTTTSTPTGEDIAQQQLAT